MSIRGSCVWLEHCHFPGGTDREGVRFLLDSWIFENLCQFLSRPTFLVSHACVFLPCMYPKRFKMDCKEQIPWTHHAPISFMVRLWESSSPQGCFAAQSQLSSTHQKDFFLVFTQEEPHWIPRCHHRSSWEFIPHISGTRLPFAPVENQGEPQSKRSSTLLREAASVTTGTTLLGMTAQEVDVVCCHQQLKNGKSQPLSHMASKSKLKPSPFISTCFRRFVEISSLLFSRHHFSSSTISFLSHKAPCTQYNLCWLYLAWWSLDHTSHRNSCICFPSPVQPFLPCILSLLFIDFFNSESICWKNIGGFSPSIYTSQKARFIEKVSANNIFCTPSMLDWSSLNNPCIKEPPLTSQGIKLHF